MSRWLLLLLLSPPAFGYDAWVIEEAPLRIHGSSNPHYQARIGAHQWVYVHKQKGDWVLIRSTLATGWIPKSAIVLDKPSDY